MSSMLVISPSLYPAAFFHLYYTKNFKNHKHNIWILSSYMLWLYSIFLLEKSPPVPQIPAGTA